MTASSSRSRLIRKLRDALGETICAALKDVDGGMAYRNVGVTMGDEAADAEFRLTVTDETAVRETIAALRAAL